MVSIKDVARVAGVSDKTVSRVVNGEPTVKLETKARVEQTIRELNYVPDLSARLIRTSRSRIIGIMSDLISTTPYSGDIVRGVQSWANANGRTVLLVNTDGNTDEEAAAWRTFREHRIEGVLYVTMYHRIVDIDPADLPLPTVLLNCRDGRARLPSVTPDDYAGSRHLACHLLGLGHRRIAYIRLNPILHGGELRFSAFRDEFAASGLPESAIEACVGMTGPVGREDNQVYDYAMAFCSRADPPSAIVCGNDEIALQVYLAALKCGLDIPKDVTVVGFDDFQTVSLGLKPQLTTVGLPYFDLGYSGAACLDRLTGATTPEAVDLALDCGLIVRGSCARASR